MTNRRPTRRSFLLAWVAAAAYGISVTVARFRKPGPTPVEPPPSKTGPDYVEVHRPYFVAILDQSARLARVLKGLGERRDGRWCFCGHWDAHTPQCDAANEAIGGKTPAR